MTDELKPCPFCGGQASEWRQEAYSIDSSYDCIGCKSCGVVIPHDAKSWDALKRVWRGDERKEAIAVWNRRTQEQTDE